MSRNWAVLFATWCCMPTPDDTPPIFSPSLTLKTLKSFIPSLLVSTHRLSNSVAPASSFKLALHKGVLVSLAAGSSGMHQCYVPYNSCERQCRHFWLSVLLCWNCCPSTDEHGNQHSWNLHSACLGLWTDHWEASQNPQRRETPLQPQTKVALIL